MAPCLRTVGHSRRTLGELVAILRAHGVSHIVDVRRFPASRRHPQFNKGQLARDLPAAGIGYRHAEGLGGLREPTGATHNDHWRDPGLRAFADYQATPAFNSALAILLAEIESRPTAILCAEASPIDCHRQIICDALVARGLDVLHLLDDERTTRHTLNPRARVQPDGTLRYPATDQLTLL